MEFPWHIVGFFAVIVLIWYAAKLIDWALSGIQIFAQSPAKTRLARAGIFIVCSIIAFEGPWQGGIVDVLRICLLVGGIVSLIQSLKKVQPDGRNSGGPSVPNSPTSPSA